LFSVPFVSFVPCDTVGESCTALKELLVKLEFDQTVSKRAILAERWWDNHYEMTPGNSPQMYALFFSLG
jgi:hypothetical protein